MWIVHGRLSVPAQVGDAEQQCEHEQSECCANGWEIATVTNHGNEHHDDCDAVGDGTSRARRRREPEREVH